MQGGLRGKGVQWDGWDAERRLGPPHLQVGGELTCWSWGQGHWACNSSCRGVRVTQGHRRKPSGPGATRPGPGPWRGSSPHQPKRLNRSEGFAFLLQTLLWRRQSSPYFVSTVTLRAGFNNKTWITEENCSIKANKKLADQKGVTGLYFQVEEYIPPKHTDQGPTAMTAGKQEIRSFWVALNPVVVLLQIRTTMRSPFTAL